MAGSVPDAATYATLVQLFNATAAQIDALETSVQSNAAALLDLSSALNAMWVLLCGYLVFIMQLGFALLEAGSVRAINTKNILMQNTLDTCISIGMFWLIGWGIARGNGVANGGNAGIGNMAQAATKLPLDQHASFFFLLVFCNAATTIVSGSVTSRINFYAYLASCVLISGWTFPVVSYWVWHEGWLGTLDPSGLGVIDFAGGLVVHMVGGFSAITGAIIVGPRTGRFKRNDATGEMEDHRESGHSVILACIGTFLLWFGWFGFNSGSTFGLSNGAYLLAGNAAVNSLIASASAGLTIAAWSFYFSGIHDVWELLNGILCGLVSVTPACGTVEPWGALLIGIFAIPVYRGGVRLVARLHIDDVVDAFAVHGCCGIFGTLATGLLSTQALCDRAYGVGRIDYHPGRQLGVQLIAVLAVAAFTSTCSLTLFTVIKYTVGIRVAEVDERVGLDFKYHAGYAYSDFNVRVKKAHEQIAMEAEIATQVRRAMAAGKGARFKDAIAASTTMFDSAAGMQQQADREAANSKEGPPAGTTSQLHPQSPPPQLSPVGGSAVSRSGRSAGARSGRYKFQVPLTSGVRMSSTERILAERSILSGGGGSDGGGVASPNPLTVIDHSSTQASPVPTVGVEAHSAVPSAASILRPRPRAQRASLPGSTVSASTVFPIAHEEQHDPPKTYDA